jgi:hypothetical protein
LDQITIAHTAVRGHYSTLNLLSELSTHLHQRNEVTLPQGAEELKIAPLNVRFESAKKSTPEILKLSYQF